uniref:ATP-dependent Clp protease proteolytic subunit n=1 Tax=Styrax faberi TaxID=153531 RepID=A0A7G7WNW1_9ERIC|nr:clp protease proteolytic subunit [Styrax faberi]QNH68238.1 clp protease proteolytic subunit [Styrax faberi]
MPIGVPKVPFRSPGEEDASWVDVYRLYRERLLFLGQEVDSEISNQLIGLMVYLSIEDDTKDLYLFINSPGGWVIPGVAIYDTIQFVQPDVHTICMGLAASMGSFILVGGEITKRLAFPHGKGQSYCRAVCNAQKMPVRLFNPIFFLAILYLCFFSLHFIVQDRGTFYYIMIMLYHQGNDSSTR